jgi:hypothetical protein
MSIIFTAKLFMTDESQTPEGLYQHCSEFALKDSYLAITGMLLYGEAHRLCFLENL